ncbi:hypothetical protein BV898_17091 [Hypsibius exemplaris]|uniref:Tc1-like transposase DDE domain-containing protein n=1 Tax=Hypsibius exemplaris TaxID=2072580 RepID=A0A9X6NN12_HYPEX|nr:hypothetical protein BV898_17091 [Hypsibius exemplaris]
MAPKINFEIKGRILELYHFLRSSRKIQKNLAEKGIDVSQSTISRVIKSDKEANLIKKKPAKNVNNGGLPVIRTQQLIKKVAKMIDTPNPPTQREISCKLGVSTGTVSRVLKKNLGQTFRKKVTTHVLTRKQAQQRLDRGPYFLRCLSRRNLPRIVSLDEMYLDMNDFTCERKGYYASDDKPVPAEWKKKPRSGWPGKVMVCMGISWNGTTSLYFVPPKAKMNGRMFIDLVLKPMLKNDILRLYPGEEKKFILHMDSAGAHVKDTVVEWLQDQKIRFITKEEWMANSPDLSRWITA